VPVTIVDAVHVTDPNVPPSATTLSEHDSKNLLASLGVPFSRERKVSDADSAVAAAEEIGFPVVVKLGGDRIAHKSERGLVRLGLAGPKDVRIAAESLLAAARPEDGEVHLLVAEMVRGTREMIMGYLVDPQFGPTVMVGLGGTAAEVLRDVVFRPAPVDEQGATEMIAALRSAALFGPFRGEQAADMAALAVAVASLSRVGAGRPDVVSVDINPLIVTTDGRPVAVDALVEVGDSPYRPAAARAPYSEEQFRALFEPRGVLVAGASTHPGKFGFVSLHNILASGYAGRVLGTNLQGEEVLGMSTLRSVDEAEHGSFDLVFVCTPASANPDLLRACAAKGARAAFLTSAGYGEAGAEGKRAEEELVALSDDLGMLLAGPNGQGVVSTPASLCAQIVAPYPPAGAIAVASQSGNFVSSFMNHARHSGVGISRAVSAGNAAALGVADLVEFYATDDATAVSLAYVEGIADGRVLLERLGAASRRKPVVLLKGGASSLGARAAASHTGALAADDAVFDGACRAAAVVRAATVEEAFETAATFATQPVPRGPNVVILTTAGGWGVVTADAIATDGRLTLLDLPGDLLAAIDTKLPPRWSRNNPVDCAGGETRDTIPEVLEMIVGHPSVDAVIYLGLGIQANQARMMREGRFHPDHGLGRIVEYHERQDARFATAAAELSVAHDKPVLVCTELAVADSGNAGVRAVRDTGRYCYPSGNRAVVALANTYEHAKRTGAAR
jgi:acetyltransferase